MPIELVSQGKTVNRQAGFSLLELLIIIVILGVTAAIVAPSISTSNINKLDLAAEEVAQAFRFARSESIRSGEIHGIYINQTSGQVTVYKADITTTPVSIDTIVYHPISKLLFDFKVGNTPLTADVSISNTLNPFLYGATRRQQLLFDVTGTPVWIDNTAGNTVLSDEAKVQLSYQGVNRFVEVAPITGRVTVY